MEILRQHATIDDHLAHTIAFTIASRMADRWGGQTLYFPKGNWNGGRSRWFQLAERDWKIFKEFDGTNRDAICQKYGISRSRLYQIINAVREASRVQL